jgi:hypothetical protein
MQETTILWNVCMTFCFEMLPAQGIAGAYYDEAAHPREV